MLDLGAARALRGARSRLVGVIAAHGSAETDEARPFWLYVDLPGKKMHMAGAFATEREADRQAWEWRVGRGAYFAGVYDVRSNDFVRFYPLNKRWPPTLTKRQWRKMSRAERVAAA